jgi:hypothetical protein
MIIYLALFVPIIVTAIFYFIKKHQFVWWEFFIPIGSVLILTIISKLLIDTSSVKFTEYWGSTVVAVYEEEPYNYWHHQTCTRSVPCGTDDDGNTEYCDEEYDCSHQDDVGPSWWAKTNIGESFSITEQQHDELVRQFGTKKGIYDSRRNYAPRDRAVGSSGTKFEGKRVGETSYIYQTNWGGEDNTRKAYTSVHTYVNKIKASDLSIFNMKIVSDEEADSLGLFKYPPYRGGLFSMTEGLEYPTILGSNVSKETQEKFKRLNGKFGSTNQLRLWILVFENKPMSIAEYQKNYWVNGNKNELVVCIGKKGNEIQWSQSFSWAHSDVLTVAVKNEVLNLYTYRDSLVKRNVPQVLPVGQDVQKKVMGKVGEKLPAGVIPVPKQVQSDTIYKVKSSYPMLTEKTWDEYYNFLNQNLNQFQRRSFEEFSYLKVNPSKGAVIFIFIFALVVAVGVNFWVINNDIN